MDALGLLKILKLTWNLFNRINKASKVLEDWQHHASDAIAEIMSSIAKYDNVRRNKCIEYALENYESDEV